MGLLETLLGKISDGRTDLIIDFLDQGGDPNTVNQYGQYLISVAAYYGDVTAIKYLVKRGATLDQFGRNFDLNGAAFHGHWQLCQYLLANGASPMVSLEGTAETPLHSCLSKANNPRTGYIIDLLLAAGADPNAKTAYRKETGGFMRDAFTQGETPLHRAAAFGTTDMIHTLIEAGADPSIKDGNGDTPLSWASWHLRPAKILSLLCYGRHHIHPQHIEIMQSDHGYGMGGGSMLGLLGKPHI